MSHQSKDYFNILRAKGYRVTSQRLVILDAVCESRQHTTLGEIFARVRSIDSSIDRSTLYRTLDLFEKVGLVVSAIGGTGEKVYEIAKAEKHHHLVCKQCGKELSIDHELVRPLFDTLERHYNFSIKMDHLMVFGVCTACQQNQHRQP